MSTTKRRNSNRARSRTSYNEYYLTMMAIQTAVVADKNSELYLRAREIVEEYIYRNPGYTMDKFCRHMDHETIDVRNINPFLLFVAMSDIAEEEKEPVAEA